MTASVILPIAALVFGVGVALAVAGWIFEGPVQRWLEGRFRDDPEN